jgi:hypothetical protein
MNGTGIYGIVSSLPKQQNRLVRVYDLSSLKEVTFTNLLCFMMFAFF